MAIAPATERREVAEYKNQAEILLAQAIEKNVPIEALEKLLVMRKELKAEWAKEQFDIGCPRFKENALLLEKQETC